MEKNMFEYTVNKDCSVAKVKSMVKNDVTDNIINFLNEEFGEENVGMVRIGSTSKANEIGAIVANVDKDGNKKPVAITINITAKEFEDGKTASGKTKTAFDFAAARAEYEDYITTKEAKNADKAKAKAIKIKEIKEKEDAVNDDDCPF